MRKSIHEAAETRERIVRAASVEFRRNGIDGTGLKDLMAAAGMTHGGFYKHFESKDQVVQESVSLAATALAESVEATFAGSSSKTALEKMIASYLSAAHEKDPGNGCPFVALGSELARSSDSVQDATTSGFSKIVDLIAEQLKGIPKAAAKKKAMVVLSTMIGAGTMARVVNDPGLSVAILNEAKKHLSIFISD